MARFARVGRPGCPHHLIQRGNRRQRVFFSDEDKAFYLTLLGRQAKRCGISIWAFCLMENHVHVIAVPASKDSFARGFGEVQRKYTLVINTRENWKGFLWQGRLSPTLSTNDILMRPSDMSRGIPSGGHRQTR